jgi:hypothetical protein
MGGRVILVFPASHNAAILATALSAALHGPAADRGDAGVCEFAGHLGAADSGAGAYGGCHLTYVLSLCGIWTAGPCLLISNIKGAIRLNRLLLSSFIAGVLSLVSEKLAFVSFSTMVLDWTYGAALRRSHVLV